MSDKKWVRTGRLVNSEGTTNTYWLMDTDITVQSRKRHIPHANGIGTWDHTSYFVLKNDVEVIEKHSLNDAKEYAEGL